ncbi:MAG: mevalonate kinase [Acidilobus sp.]
MSRRVTARAPAKAILFGEHFVVSGTRAVSSAVGAYTIVNVEEKASWPSELASRELGIRALVLGPDGSFSGPEEFRPIAFVIRALTMRGYDVPPFSLSISTEIPDGAGLGSSASVSAASALALLGLAGSDVSRDDLYSITLEGERAAHGNPSGVDPASVVHGGIILFSRERGVIERVEGVDDSLLIIADSGIRRKTYAPVTGVLNLLKRLEYFRDELLRAADSLVMMAWDALKRKRTEELGILMNVNHGLLSSIGVSTWELDAMVHAARRAGALGSKLTGAGLGGSIIALVRPESEEAVRKALSPMSRWIRIFHLGAEGAALV